MRKETPSIPCFSCHPQARKLIGLILIGLTILSCAGYPLRSERPRGIYHRVKGGETLFAIARAYRVNLQDLAEINNIANPDQIEADSVIFVPDANQVLDDVLTAARSQKPTVSPQFEPPPEKPKSAPQEKPAAEPSKKPETAEPAKKTEAAEPPKKPPAGEAVKKREEAPVASIPKERPAPSPHAEERTPRPAVPEKPEGVKIESPPVRPGDGKKEEIHFDRKRFVWPVTGKVVAKFGMQPNRMYFNGIRIAAAEGTAVSAAAGGVVIFSQPLKDYGETVIIRHDDQYATVYTQLGIRTVREEIRVKQGDRIAFIGKADGGREPYLHFEIRHRNKARNPLFFLP